MLLIISLLPCVFALRYLYDTAAIAAARSVDRTRVDFYCKFSHRVTFFENGESSRVVLKYYLNMLRKRNNNI